MALLESSSVQNAQGLVDEETVYLSAFRTAEEYRGKGYFSRLFQFMMEDLKKRGYTRATLGVEPDDTKNREIYFSYGFVEHIRDACEVWPDGTRIRVEYYSKKL